MDIVAIIGAAASVVISITTILTFYGQKLRDAEEQGRLKQRVDSLEKDIVELGARLAENDSDNNDAEVKIAKLDEAIDNLKERLDDIPAERGGAK